MSEDIRDYVITNFAENPSILVGCRIEKWSWPVCGYDVIVFTNNVKNYHLDTVSDDILNIYYHSLEEIDRKKNQELDIILSNAVIINDPNLSLAACKEKLLKRKSELFLEAFEEHLLKLLKNLTYSEEAYNLGAYASSTFWILTVGYDVAAAINLLNRTLTSPSHLMQQVRENPLFKETNFFVNIAGFLGLEHATTASSKRVFSVLETFKKLADFYKFEELPPTEFPRTKILLSNIRMREISRKCDFANSQNMPLNAYVAAIKWFIDSTIELYQIICSMENTSQFKPRIIEELEKRRNVMGGGMIISNPILLEINPSILREKIDEAKRILYWLRKNKI
jgi:hypothetical protein